MIAGGGLVALLSLARVGVAQDWSGNYSRLSRIEAGTFIQVRTTANITSDRADGRIFSGVVNEDVWDDYRRLAVPAIPRGSPVELIVRTARDGDLIVDLESVIAHGQRYAVAADAQRIDAGGGHPGDRSAEYIGGGALLGTVIGAIAGGGKGAAIGAAAGAATGLGLAYHGRSISVPAGSILTFQLARSVDMGVRDEGYRRNRYHYHQYPEQP